MNKKTIIKILFTLALSSIVVVMIMVSTSLGNQQTSVGNILNQELDYKIIYKSDKCTSYDNLIYKENNKEYYTECYRLKDIYINWSNAKIDTLEKCLKEKTVSIASLKEHGLVIKVVESHEY